MYNASGLQGLAIPFTSRYSSSQIPPYIGLGRRERDAPGFMPLVLYLWLAILMRNRDRSNNVMIFHRDVHMAAKVAALDHPPQVCSLHLTKQKRLDWARSYHHEVTQRVQAGVDQTRLAQCQLWIQFRIPMWVEDKNVGYARPEVSTAEEASQHAHAEIADEDLEDLEDNDEEPVLTATERRSRRKSTQLRAFQAGDADNEARRRRSSGRWDSESATGTPPRKTRRRTPTWG